MNRPLHREVKGLPGLIFTWRRLIVLGGIIGVLTMAAVFLGPVAWDWWTNRQINLLDKLALEASQRGDENEALKLVTTAYQRNPSHPQTMRTLATLLDHVPGGLERAAFHYQQLIHLKAATSADRAAFGKTLLRMGRKTDARTAFEAISQADRNQRPVLELEAALLAQDGHPDEAREKLRAAYLADPASSDSQLRLAVLDLANPFHEVQEQAEQRLWEIVRSDSAQAAEAMEQLAQRPALSPSQVAELASRAITITTPTDARRFRILNSSIRALPLEKERIIEEETTRQGAKAVESLPFLHWLTENGASQKVLSILTPETASQSAQLFSAYVAALEASHRWAELRDLLAGKSQIPASPFQRALLQAQCAAGLKAPVKEIRSFLEEALKLATGPSESAGVLAAGNTADALGQQDIALKAFERLAEKPHNRLPLLDRILQIQHRERDLPAMLATLDRCLAERPGLSPYLETACYLRLLTGAQIELATADSADLEKQRTGADATVRLVRSLAAYRQGDLKTAAAEADQINSAKLPPGQRAVLSGILHACGKKTEAFQLAEKVPQTLLLDEETVFLRRAF